MCQYSSRDGVPDDWHLVHLGARATGGAGAVIVEASAVSPEGRISPDDSGIWSDEQAAAFRPIAAFLAEHGAVPGIQIAHAGRKASSDAPWRGGRALGPDERGWTAVAPSALAYDDGWQVPHELTGAEIAGVVDDFAASALRSHAAGFRLLEVHAAHGYLLHEFLSPLSNRRSDRYGGDFAARSRLLLEVVAAVRAVWPAELPLSVRISASDWVDGGWSLQDSVALAAQLVPLGVDIVDCSSGGLSPLQQIELGPGYQVPFSAAIRRGADVATAAVGLITDPQQAEAILQAGDADVVLLGRESLRDPSWPLRAAVELGVDSDDWPMQYRRARPHMAARTG
jgi:2,4-dienoyl-CoA reductase-like NADH-dependent reductase (Old Yellow Enzyme family)